MLTARWGVMTLSCIAADSQLDGVSKSPVHKSGMQRLSQIAVSDYLARSSRCPKSTNTSLPGPADQTLGRRFLNGNRCGTGPSKPCAASSGCAGASAEGRQEGSNAFVTGRDHWKSTCREGACQCRACEMVCGWVPV